MANSRDAAPVAARTNKYCVLPSHKAHAAAPIRIASTYRESLPSGSSRMLSCIREGEERSPALRGRRVGLRIVVHDFVHRRRAYRGFGGSSVRMFAISYVE